MLLACAIFFLFSFSQAWETSLKISKEVDDPFCEISVNDTLQQNLIFEDVGVAANVTVLGGYRVCRLGHFLVFFCKHIAEESPKNVSMKDPNILLLTGRGVPAKGANCGRRG